MIVSVTIVSRGAGIFFIHLYPRFVSSYLYITSLRLDKLRGSWQFLESNGATAFTRGRTSENTKDSSVYF